MRKVITAYLHVGYRPGICIVQLLVQGSKLGFGRIHNDVQVRLRIQL